MKNLNKFTKAELINKFKEIQSQISDQNLNQNFNQNNIQDIINNKLEEQKSKQSYLIKTLKYFVHFKSLIFKITLITFLIR
jgi:hypothetical protein